MRPLFFYTIIFTLFFLGKSYAWNDKITHPTISEYAAKMFFGEDILKSLIRQGSTELTVKEWIREGAEREDDWLWYRLSASRSRNHFHAPNRPLDTAGWKETSGMSTPLWAQYGTEQERFVGGDWSWRKVRLLYYNHLTAADTAVRDGLEASYLKGLGYQMHLVQDMSQPNHVRDDTHIADGFGWKLIVNGLETWAKDHDRDIIKQEILDRPDIYPIPHVQVDLKQLFNNDTTMVPVARLYDTRSYASSPTPSTSLAQGLAEYTNANFFSESTAFAAERNLPTDTRNYFPYPRKSETNLHEFLDKYLEPVVRTDVDGKDYATFEIAKHNTTGESLDCLAMPGPYTLNFFQEYGGESGMFYGSFRLDERCMKEYAGKLVPRAVGYSTALLDYFFRGKLSIATIAPGDITFRSVKVTASNNTTGEAMGPGVVSLVVRYKALAETADGGRYKLHNPSAEYSYKVITLPGTIDLSSTKQLAFDFSESPLPLHFSDMTMQLVYRGSLGNEADAVAVSEPKAIDGIYGNLAVYLPDSGVYAKTSNNGNYADFRELRVNVATDISEGLLSGGSFMLELEYRSALSNQFEVNVLNTDPADAAAYIFKTGAVGSVSSLPPGGTAELVFDLSSLPFSVQSTDLEVNIVYIDANGKKLAAGVRDISEPNPVDVFNSTDYSCLNGQWYRYDDPTAMTIVDSNGDGIADRFDIYPHTVSNISFLAGAAGTGTLDATAASTLTASGPLPTGEKLRLGYILTDYSNRYAYSALRTGPAGDPGPPLVSNNSYTGMGFRNDDVWYNMFSFRNKLLWWGTGVVFVNRTNDDSCTWDALQHLLGL